VYFGKETHLEVSEVVRSENWQSALIVTDPVLSKSNVRKMLETSLANIGCQYRLLDTIQPNPTTHGLNSLYDEVRTEVHDFVLVVGGGSALDTAKALALMLTNGRPAEELDYRVSGIKPGLPIIAIPSTAGTGSETNSWAVVENSRHNSFILGMKVFSHVTQF